MNIRQATEADLATIESFDEMSGDRRSEILARHCFAAVNEDRVVGYASYVPGGLLGEPLLTYLCVHEDFRRQRIGKPLVRHIQSTARGRKLITSTEAWCVASQRLFEKLGWQKIGELTGVNEDGSAEIFYAIDLLP